MAKDTLEGTGNGPMNSVGKAALVLRTLATFCPRGAALNEIAFATRLPKTTAHRILGSLLEQRLVERPEGTRLYRLGAELFAFGTSISSMFDFREAAADSLKRIPAETGEMALLGIRSGYDPLCLARNEGTNTPKDVLIQLMDRWPLGIGVFSLALLAFLPPAEISEILHYNERRIGDPERYSSAQIMQLLGRVRRESHIFLTFPALLHSTPKAGLAVPILDHYKRPVASLCMIAEEWRMRGNNRKHCTDILFREAERIREDYLRQKDSKESSISWKSAVVS